MHGYTLRTWHQVFSSQLKLHAYIFNPKCQLENFTRLEFNTTNPVDECVNFLKLLNYIHDS